MAINLYLPSSISTIDMIHEMDTKEIIEYPKHDIIQAIENYNNQLVDMGGFAISYSHQSSLPVLANTLKSVITHIKIRQL